MCHVRPVQPGAATDSCSVDDCGNTAVEKKTEEDGKDDDDESEEIPCSSQLYS